MQIREVVNSLTFRYIVKYVTVLSAAVFLLQAIFYLYFSYTSFRDLGDSVVDELETLATGLSRTIFGRGGAVYC